MVDKSIIYSSNDLQNFLISLFAKPRVGACLMDIRWELWEAVKLIPNDKLFFYYYHYITFSCVY